MEKKVTLADLKVGMVFETVLYREPRKLVRNGTQYQAVHPDTGHVGGAFTTLEDLLYRFNALGVYRLRPQPVVTAADLKVGILVGAKGSAADPIELHFPDGTTVIVSVDGAGVSVRVK